MSNSLHNLERVKFRLRSPASGGYKVNDFLLKTEIMNVFQKFEIKDLGSISSNLAYIVIT